MDLEARFLKTVAKRLKVDEAEVRPEGSLAFDYDCDSLDAVGLLMTIEKEFGVKFPKGSATKVKTIADVRALLDSALAVQQEA